MKSSLIKGIGEVVTDYGARVMKVIKKGLLQRSLFDFYGDVKADTFRTKENSSVPGTPADGKGGVMYTKSSDGKLYYKSNEVAEVELSTNQATTFILEDGDGTEVTLSQGKELKIVEGTGIDVDWTDTDNGTDADPFDITISCDLEGTELKSTGEGGGTKFLREDGDGTSSWQTTPDTNTQLTQEQVEDYAGALVATGGTKTGISVTYQDGTGDVDFEVDHDAATNFVAAEHYRWDNDISGTATVNSANIPTLNQNTSGTAAGLSATLVVGSGGTGTTSLAADSILTGNGSSAIVAESYLTYSTSGEELIIGNPDAGDAQISRRDSSGTDTAGGKLIISAGAATGDAAGGAIEFHSSVAGSSGSSVQSTAGVATISKDGDLSIDGKASISSGRTTEAVEISDFTVASDSFVQVSASGDTDDHRVGLKLKHNVDTYGFTLQSQDGVDGLHGLNVLRHEDSAGGNSALFIERDNGDVGIGNTAPTVKLEVTGDIKASGTLTAKQKEIYFHNIEDKLGTGKIYIPFKSVNETTYAYLEESCFLAPCDGRIVSLTIRAYVVNSTGDVTVDVLTFGLDANPVSGSWTAEESKVHTISSTDGHHAFHYVFDNAKHFESGELVAVGVQSDTALDSFGAPSYWHMTTVVEYDWNNQGFTSHAEYDAAQ